MTALAIPSIPSLPAGYVVALADLQALAYACTFLLTLPMTRVFDGTGGAAITTSPTNVSFTTESFDVDNMWIAGSPARLTVQTPGWYKIRYGINLGTVAGVFNSNAISTTGANNPAGAGVGSGAFWGGYADTASSGWACASGIWPFYLYSGDFVQVQIQAAAAGSSTGIAAPGGVTGAGSYFSMTYVSIL